MSVRTKGASNKAHFAEKASFHFKLITGIIEGRNNKKKIVASFLFCFINHFFRTNNTSSNKMYFKKTLESIKISLITSIGLQTIGLP